MARELQTRIVCLYGFEPDMQLLEVCMAIIYEKDCMISAFMVSVHPKF